MTETLETRHVERLLATRIGLDPASIGRDEVGRAVRRRMDEVGCERLADYLTLIEGGEEWDELVELVLVPETWFFREPTAYTLLDRLARQLRADRTFRVLSMPCSTGAEPYSMAITLREAGLAPDRFRVEALDLSRRALEEAQAAVYGARAVRHVAPRLLQTYFAQAGDKWQVVEEVRRLVRFSRGNLVDPDVLSAAAPFDVVFCRNVLIYLDPPARQRLLDSVSRLLRDDGVLVTGHAETTNVVAPLFVSAGVPRTFAYMKRSASTSTQHERLGVAKARVDVGARASVPPAAAAPGTPTRTSPPPRRSGPGNQDRGRPGTHELELASIRRLADSGNLAKAIVACEAWLETHPSSTEGHFILGVTAGAARRIDQAESAFRRALYLDPSHEGALTHLAALRERAGDAEEARRLRTRARRSPGVGGPRR